jgi:hypothetical protein
MKTAFLFLLLPTTLVAQTTVGLRLGLGTFRENRTSVYRYELPTISLQLTHFKNINTNERFFQASLDWGQNQQPGRSFQRAAGLGASWQRTYGIAKPAGRWGRLALGWQAHFGLRAIYERLDFSEAANGPLGGYAALELAPVLAWRLPLQLGHHNGQLTTYLSAPLVAGLAAGVRSDADFTAGAFGPGTFGGVSNQLWYVPSEASRWRVGYLWSYRSLRHEYANQQHATNSISVNYCL